MQFGEHDVVVASTNNESFNEISRPRTVLFDSPNDATTVVLVTTSNGGQDVLVMTPDFSEINCKMEISLEDTPKPRAALFKEGEDDEPMASQNIPVENSCLVSNIVTGLLFGAFFMIKNI